MPFVTMEEAIRILILEDVATDAELIERELRKADMALSTRRATTKEHFLGELRDFSPHLILADYSLAGLDGVAALEMAREKDPDIPFVFVSGAIGEELAIETLKRGATDYVLKDRLSRLSPAVRRALREASERRERRAMQGVLGRSEERYRVRLQITNAIITNLDRESLFQAIGQALCDVLTCDGASLTLYDLQKNTLRVYALAGPSLLKHTVPVGIEMPLEETVVGAALKCGTPYTVNDLSLEPGSVFEDRLLQEGIRSVIVLPLMSKGRAIGTLNFGSVTKSRYSNEDVEFLGEVANQVAMALENMLAYEEIARLRSRLEQENLYLQEEIRTAHNFKEIIGESPAIKTVLKAVETVAPTGANVLILGETGTGKELIARALHNLSPRKDKPLVKVNCAAIPAGLVESELFGHEKGAFTGALTRKIGRFELAHGGTIFLDEVGDLPLELQAKLLRVLQEGEFERIGGTHTVRADVRVIAATNRGLEQSIQEGKFRGDLFYRLNVFPIQLPALRERKEDIPVLLRYFVEKYGMKLGKRIQSVPQKTIDAFLAYLWPGNVRELENVVERSVIISPGHELHVGNWLSRTDPVSSRAKIETLEALERNHILEVLQSTGWRVRGEQGAAKLLDIKATTLEARMKKLGIKREA